MYLVIDFILYATTFFCLRHAYVDDVTNSNNLLAIYITYTFCLFMFPC